jgi:WD40 repeat protein
MQIDENNNETAEEGFDEEFINDQDIQEELEIGEQPVEEDEDQTDIHQEEFKDDSVQGFFEHKEPVFCCSISPLHPMICASGGGNDASFLWSMETGEKIFNLGVHQDSCTAVKFSCDGIYVASGGMDGKIMVFQTEDGVLVSNLEGLT